MPSLHGDRIVGWTTATPNTDQAQGEGPPGSAVLRSRDYSIALCSKPGATDRHFAPPSAENGERPTGFWEPSIGYKTYHIWDIFLDFEG